ncbi:MAG: phytanoyl-CoA dioxygenase family protein [Terrimicrobiaceae bacterium]
MNAHFTEQHKRSYLEDGFVNPGIILPEESIAPVREYLIAKKDSSGDSKPGGTFLADLHPESKLVADFCTQPLFVEMCRLFIGPEAYLCWSQMIAKEPGKSGVFAWHQDGHYALANGEDKGSIESESLTAQVVCWIAITEANRRNGGLTIAPRWHTRGLLPHKMGETDRAWHCQFEPETECLAEVPAGGFVLFSRFTPHKSGPNLSDKVRLGLQIAFRSSIRPSDVGRAIKL